MIYLVLGVVLFAAGHMLKRLAPGIRHDLATTLGVEPSKGVVALVMMAGLVLMILGYLWADFIPVYTPMPGAGHLNNTLMLIALFVTGIGMAGGRLSARMRHPMLWGTILFAFAHLLVNGDLASIVLFGGLGLWALVQIRLINQHEGPWERPMPGNALRDGKLALAVLFLYVVITGIHWLFGHNPFLGTYG